MNKTYTHTIKTSGYSDRYLYTELKIHDAEATFRDAEAYAKYAVAHGIESDYETAWDEAYNAPATHQMYGKTSRTTSATVILSNDDRRSINAYLVIKHGKLSSYTVEAVEKFRAQLESHPLTGDLLEIVKWQVAQCDKSNIETWGNANGQEANWMK